MRNSAEIAFMTFGLFNYYILRPNLKRFAVVEVVKFFSLTRMSVSYLPTQLEIQVIKFLVFYRSTTHRFLIYIFWLVILGEVIHRKASLLNTLHERIVT